MSLPPRRNVLFLAHRVPYPPDKGDRIRSFNVLKFLSERADVHLACLADEPVSDENIRALSAHCVRLAVVPVGGLGRWGRALWSLARGRTVTEGAFNVPGLHHVLRAWASEVRF